MYRIPKIDFTARCVFTNTAPIGPYRGAGRPEANYALERVVEEAARITGIDPVQLRRKNLIPPSAMPYKTAVGTTYDSGDFPALFAKALELADYKNFNKRKREAARRKKLRGIGISCMLEHAGALPTESAVDGVSRRRQARPGAQRAIDRAGPRHRVRPAAGRTARHRSASRSSTGTAISASRSAGFASVGSRSAMTAGNAIVHTADVMLAKGKKIASALLEASEADIQYRNGNFEVIGTDRSISLFETARRAKEMAAKASTPRTRPTRR